MKIFLIICLTISIIGITLLLILSLTFSPKKINIKIINEDFLYKKVKVIGKITSINNQKDFQIITIRDSTGSIQIFSKNKKIFQKDQTLLVMGKVQEYKNKLQINSEKIISMTLKLS
jgi:DNA/RNA endonuclease YhcR with UshA esterase domain